MLLKKVLFLVALLFHKIKMMLAEGQEPLFANLSKREIEVLKLFCDGVLLKQIADELCISTNTVKHHMKNIHRKTSINSAQRLVKFAIKNDLTEID